MGPCKEPICDTIWNPVSKTIMVWAYNTSLNKLSVWHIDGTMLVKYIWFLDSTNLQTISVEISWESDVWCRSYRDLGEATFVIFKTMGKKEFQVLIKHCFLMGKILLKQISGLISVMGTLHQGNQQSLTGMPNLNAVVQTPMTLNALVAQNQQ